MELTEKEKKLIEYAYKAFSLHSKLTNRDVIIMVLVLLIFIVFITAVLFFKLKLPKNFNEYYYQVLFWIMVGNAFFYGFITKPKYDRLMRKMYDRIQELEGKK